MLSVPTLWTVFVINFLALGLIWAYVMRSYPSFDAARFWTAAAFAAAAGAACAMGRVVVTESLVPLLFGGALLVLASCLAAMGIRRFYGQPVSWRATAFTKVIAPLPSLAITPSPMLVRVVCRRS